MVDGERRVYRLLQTGDRAEARVRQRAVLHAGDAGALAVTINGGRAISIGSLGDVRTVEITSAGDIRPVVE
jgi:hypothetical protein